MRSQQALLWDSEALTDTHCHVDHLTLQGWQDVHQRAIQASVKNFVIVSVSQADFYKSRDILPHEFHPFLSLGTHPHEAKTYDRQACEKLFDSESYVAVGECGLDYHYEHSSKDVQRDVFEHQLEMACVHKKPLIAHVRDAFADATPLIQHYGRKGVRGVVHCFTGSVDQLRPILDVGWYAGFTGIVTFGSKNDAILNALHYIPWDRVLLETDSPYLAPSPHRGKPNESGYLPIIAQAVAEVKSSCISEVTKVTTQNAIRLFLEQS